MNLRDVEEVARMLPVKCGDQLSAVKLRRCENGKRSGECKTIRTLRALGHVARPEEAFPRTTHYPNCEELV